MHSVLPKRELVHAILSSMDQATARTVLSIQPGTNLEYRLKDLPKDRLLFCLENGGQAALAELKRREQEYPLRSSPNCYLLIVNHQPDWEAIRTKASELSTGGRGAAIVNEKEAVRAVYTSAVSRIIPGPPNMLELQVAYEIRMDYVEPDPSRDNYGEMQSVYSLERALVWLPAPPRRHAVLVLADFLALNPIRDYLRRRFGLECQLPNLTEEMLRLISRGARPRSASFQSRTEGRSGPLDSATVLIADPDLAKTNAYKALTDDRRREQTSGFFSNHPNLDLGGLGISRRYGRIWTPARLGTDALRRLASGIIDSVERQLAVTLGHSLRDFVAYHRNTAVRVGAALIQGKTRDAFDLLAVALLAAQQGGVGRHPLNDGDVLSVVKHSAALRLPIRYQIDCPGCHLQTVGLCPDCERPVEARIVGGALVAWCRCGHNFAGAPELMCECQTRVQVADFMNHLFGYALPESVDALRTFLASTGQSFQGLLFLDGREVSIIPQAHVIGPTTVSLDDLELWRDRGKIEYRSGKPSSQVLNDILDNTKEKCYRNGVVTDRTRCDACGKTRPTLKQLEAHDLCLPRIFGIPIEQFFDGIHSGAEMADVKYDDVLDGVGSVRVGIHIKSADKHTKKLGRGNERIKGLYAQLAYSIYQVRRGVYPFDVLGVSVPQEVNPTDLAALRFMAAKAGTRLLVMQRSEWLKVAEAASEQLQF